MATLNRIGKLLVTIKEEYVIYENSDTKRIHLRGPDDGASQTQKESFLIEDSLEDAIEMLKGVICDYSDPNRTITIEEDFDA